ncbi:amidase [Stutzerimonas azotifigens]|uniref:amidase n=1 Tax=Stutzerimonas azotifigens TaxID=291995 RepID=UPI000403718B|nr:amidase [Stutzerimonas azotifigens]
MTSELLQPGYHGAFVRDGFGAAPADARAASGWPRLAVKDVFEVAGLTCGAGNPRWLGEQIPARRSAAAVRGLLAAGAVWVGKTVTDELTYSLAGINRHYGTPVNPSAPDRLPGGSSSGSAVAVAADHADLALGTDCGGSIRLPASYCGIWGLRPTHGRIATEGCFTLAQSFDTVGWLARDGETLGRALEALAHTSLGVEQPAGRLLVSADVLAQLDPAVRERFERALADSGLEYQSLVAGSLPLQHWAQAFRTLQAGEIGHLHGPWVRERAPQFGADVAARFAMAMAIEPAAVAAAAQVRRDAQIRLGALLGADGLLLLPPVPGPAPRLSADAAEVDDTRARSQALLCMAGLAGLPQAVMPWTSIDGGPVGLSVLGPRHADELVLHTLRALHGRFRG